MSDTTTDPEPQAPRPRRIRHRKVFAVLPTLLTLCNAACGFGAISIAAKVGPDHFAGSELVMAAYLIFLAMVFDMLDGSAARLTNQTSDFGAQLDSLSDAISFGVAPAFLMLQLVHPDHNLMNSIVTVPFHYPPQIPWAIAVLFMVCAILRLARFNVETDEEDSHNFFSGLPSPAAAGVVASFPLGVSKLKEWMSATGTMSWAQPVAHYLLPTLVILLPLITLAVATLMVSRIRYAHFFNQMIRRRQSRKQILQIVFAMVLVSVIHKITLPVLFCVFAFSSPIRAFWERYYLKLKKNKTPSTETKAA
ncbi:MAG: phosphatidylcholine/phosphatidylserine synthase [Fuerstia sp.]|nr:phosphatidylcholine/phosphatidylserine synthase [Fuerstiella sp.]